MLRKPGQYSKWNVLAYLFSILLLCNTPYLFGQQSPVVSLTTGNYWIYSGYSNSPDDKIDKITIKQVIGDTTINNQQWKIIKVYSRATFRSPYYNEYVAIDTSKREYWYSDENIFKMGTGTVYDKRRVKDSSVGVGWSQSYRFHIDSTLCFGKKYRSQSYYTAGPSASTSHSSRYCEKFGFLSSNGSGMGGFSDETGLIGAHIDGINYGDYLPPLIIEKWSIKNGELKINFSKFDIQEPHSKILIYRNRYDNHGIDSVITSELSISVKYPTGKYSLCFAYCTQSGTLSFKTIDISFSILPTENIVSLTAGNFWVYNNIDSIKETKEIYRSIFIVEADTIINDKTLKKVKVIELHKNKTITYYKYWYSDNLKFINYNKYGAVLNILYDWNEYKEKSNIFGILTSTFRKDGDTTDVLYGKNYQSDYTSVACEKIGLTYYRWYCYFDSKFKADKCSSLMGARIDGRTYGEMSSFKDIIPPPLINKWEIKNNFIKMDLRFLLNNDDIDKLIIYCFNSGANKYLPYDSIRITGPNITYLVSSFEANNLKFSYRTKDGIESLQSESISFTNEPYDFKIYQNYPNPFNGSTKILFAIGTPAEVNLDVINILGQRVYSETKNIASRGFYEFYIKLDNMPSGVYFYRISSNKGHLQTNKMILLK